MKSAKIKGIEEVRLVICNVNGMDLLFTEDGKLVSNQGDAGFFYYIDGVPRYKTFRTSFLVDHKNIKVVDADHFLSQWLKDKQGD